jgi:hypothetical protein
MDISIGSYKFRLEIVLIIVFLLIVMFGHTLCACSTTGFMEGMTNNTTEPKEEKKADANAKKEGFSNYKTNAGPQFAENAAPDYYMDPNKWAQPSLVYTAGTTPDAGVQAIWDRGKNQKPLAEGEMDFFANTDFKPECCPNTYSNSMGCACMTTGSYNQLITRGGNNVPYSEY